MVVAVVPLRAELALVPAFLDVAEQFDAELVGVQPLRAHGHRAGVMVGIVDDLGVGQAVLRHDRGVPVAGPAFVHDLGLALGGEVVGFVADDGEDVVLPVLQRGVLRAGTAARRVAARPGRSGWPPGASCFARRRLVSSRQHVRRVDERVHVLLGRETALRLRRTRLSFSWSCLRRLGFFRELFRIGRAADVRRVGVDQVVDRQAGVDELLDLLVAVAVDVAVDRGRRGWPSGRASCDWSSRTRRCS